MTQQLYCCICIYLREKEAHVHKTTQTNAHRSFSHYQPKLETAQMCASSHKRKGSVAVCIAEHHTTKATNPQISELRQDHGDVGNEATGQYILCARHMEILVGLCF